MTTRGAKNDTAAMAAVATLILFIIILTLMGYKIGIVGLVRREKAMLFDKRVIFTSQYEI